MKVCYSAVYPRWSHTHFTLIGELNLVSRCVAISPKEMVRQVAAARELETALAEVGFDSIRL